MVRCYVQLHLPLSLLNRARVTARSTGQERTFPVELVLLLPLVPCHTTSSINLSSSIFIADDLGRKSVSPLGMPASAGC